MMEDASPLFCTDVALVTMYVNMFEDCCLSEKEKIPRTFLAE